MIEKLKYQIVPEFGTYIEAHNGVGNLHTVKLKPIGEYTAVELDDYENFDFTANNCTRIDIICNGETISSINGLVSWLDGELYIESGAFEHITGSYNYKIHAFFDSDTIKGVLMCSDGRIKFNTLEG